jgi:DNA-binding HxlR family transcriptional regulator
MKPITHSQPADNEILDLLLSRGEMMTYVVRNWLCNKHRGLETPLVLRRLKSLEKAGRVVRVPTSYVRQIRWGIALAQKESK